MSRSHFFLAGPLKVTHTFYYYLSKGMRRAVVSRFGAGVESRPVSGSTYSKMEPTNPRARVVTIPLGNAQSVRSQGLQCSADSTYEENSKNTRNWASLAQK